MKFNLTVDKRAEAVIDGRLCVNCGKCGQVCPAEAVEMCIRDRRITGGQDMFSIPI